MIVNGIEMLTMHRRATLKKTHPTASPTLHFISFATRVDIEMAATLLGWVTAIDSCPNCNRNCGTCVVLPLPVSPMMINVLFRRKWCDSLKMNGKIPIINRFYQFEQDKFGEHIVVRLTYLSCTANTGKLLRCIWISRKSLFLTCDGESFFTKLLLTCCVLECFDVVSGFFATSCVEPGELEYANFRFKFGLNELGVADVGLALDNIEYFESISV